MKIACGVDTKSPAFEWVGSDIFQKLAQTHQITIFKNYNELKQNRYDIVFFIKEMPPLLLLVHLYRHKTKIVYIPVDFFVQKYEVEKYSPQLYLFDCVLIHCERLRLLMENYNDKVFFIDHYLKYEVDRENKSPEDFILWIGHMQYLPALIECLSQNPLNNNLKILTDVQNFSRRKFMIKREMELKGLEFNQTLDLNGNYVLNGYLLEQWTIEKQQAYLEICVAAIDTKDNSFSQATKPPTKGQIFISSGIPLAVPKNSYTHEYFKNIGLDLPDINEIERLLSEKFKNDVVNFQQRYKSKISRDEIAKQYDMICYDVIQYSEKKSLIFCFLNKLNVFRWLISKLILKIANLLNWQK